MSEVDYTPGPWEADDNEGFGVWKIYGARDVHGGGRTLAEVHGDSGETDANAHLIAAAPDLLDAARYCAEFADCHINPTLRKRLLAAIAKAEGR